MQAAIGIPVWLGSYTLLARLAVPAPTPPSHGPAPTSAAPTATPPTQAPPTPSSQNADNRASGTSAAITTALAGAVAGTTLAVTSLLTAPNASAARAVFPEFASEFRRMLPASAGPGVGVQSSVSGGRLPLAGSALRQTVVRGAVGHALFFSVYEGMTRALAATSSAARATSSSSSASASPTSSSQPLEAAAARFFAGGVASLGFRAASASLVADLERVPLARFADQAGVIGRGFVAAGAVMAAYGALVDDYLLR
ncbi:hypothetical protein DFJ73DRAFT_208513 [Zopfochytrium polystomum]|nr:hypothetical protein DFJ73DRAFT_208513 [Zopfochytrium polystomum]